MLCTSAFVRCFHGSNAAISAALDALLERAAALAAMQWEGELFIRRGMRGVATGSAANWSDRFCRVQLLDVKCAMAATGGATQKKADSPSTNPNNQR